MQKGRFRKIGVLKSAGRGLKALGRKGW